MMTRNNRLLNYLLAIYIASAILISYIPWGANISQAIGVLLAFIFVIQFLANKDKLSLTLELFIFMLFFGFSLLGAFYAKDSGTFLRSEFTLLQLVILAIIAYNIMSTPAGLNVAIKAFVISTLIAVGFAMAGMAPPACSRPHYSSFHRKHWHNPDSCRHQTGRNASDDRATNYSGI